MSRALDKARTGVDSYPRLDAPQSLSATLKSQGRSNLEVIKKNYIVNGGMLVSQEYGTSAISGPGQYPVDQFPASWSGGTISVAQVFSVTPSGSPTRLRATVTTANSPVLASQYSEIFTRIEGNILADLMFGTSKAKKVTLKFGVRAPAGTYGITFANGATNRTWVMEYVITPAEANTDVYKSVTFDGDVTGTWANDNSIGMQINWCLAAGSTYFAAPNAWATNVAVGSTNQTNFMATIGNVFELFDVGLYEGAVAPNFVLRSYGEEISICKRYFNLMYQNIFDGCATSPNAYVYFDIPIPEMRVLPTVTFGNVSYANSSSLAVNASRQNHLRVSLQLTLANSGYSIADLFFNARM